MSFVQNSAGQCLVEVGLMASARDAPNPIDVKYSAWGSPMEQATTSYTLAVSLGT